MYFSLIYPLLLHITPDLFLTRRWTQWPACMMTLSNGTIFRVTGPLCGGIHRSPVNSPHKGPVTGSFDVFLDLRLNKRLSKQPWGWLFDIPSLSLWCHCNGHLNIATLNTHSTTTCKLVDLIPALPQSDCGIPNWVTAKTVHGSSTNHGQTTARFRSFFR